MYPSIPCLQENKASQSSLTFHVCFYCTCWRITAATGTWFWYVASTSSHALQLLWMLLHSKPIWTPGLQEHLLAWQSHCNHHGAYAIHAVHQENHRMLFQLCSGKFEASSSLGPA